MPGDAADQYIAEWREGKGLRWLHTDHLGSVRSVTDISGNQIATIDDDAFGKTAANGGGGAAACVPGMLR